MGRLRRRLLRGEVMGRLLRGRLLRREVMGRLLRRRLLRGEVMGRLLRRRLLRGSSTQRLQSSLSPRCPLSPPGLKGSHLCKQQSVECVCDE